MSTLIEQKKEAVSSNVKHLPLTNPRAYYRSKVFSVTTGINPLINSAACLLTSIAYLRDSIYLADIRQLHQELIHEIKAFETQTQTQGYRSEVILIARYILCATLDEIILSSPWGAQSDWAEYKLLNTFHREEWGGERFFVILERLSIDPALHIDVLELIYLCISLGYSGKFQIIPNGQNNLHEISEQLYQHIRWQRGHIKKGLLLEEVTASAKTHRMLKNTHQPLPHWLVGVFVISIIATLYIVFNFMLGSNSASLYQQFNSLFPLYG